MKTLSDAQRAQQQRFAAEYAVTKHGKHRTGAYRSWQSMKERCQRKACRAYKYYGGRGIKVCERWDGPDGFVNFFADMGERPRGKSLERENNNGDYTPDNCRWASRTEQARNQRNNTATALEAVLIRYLGQRLELPRHVAYAFGMSTPNVRKIMNRETWANALEVVAQGSL